MSGNLEHALGYLSRGFSVVPTRPGSKRARIPWKEYQTRLPTEQEVRGWWGRYPDDGIAIITGAVSGLVVLDIDGAKGRENVKAFGSLPATPTVRTKKGGHVYLKHPGFTVKPWANPEDMDRAAENLKGIDFRGDAGYVLAPPSVHYLEDGTPSGHVYEWTVPVDEPLAEMPPWLVELCTEPVGEAEPVEASEPGLPLFATLAELTERPELLAPPECVLPRIAYRGRAVLLAAPDKAGKSTLLAHGQAAVSRCGSFLGERVNARTGDCISVGLEEALGDAVRRFVDLGADPHRVRLITMSPPDVLPRLKEQLAAAPADLVVVDSLTEYARVAHGTVPEDGDSAGWAAVVRPLVAVAREHDTALVLLHHVRRSDGQYRGSGEIAASVDALLEMVPPAQGEDPRVRRIRGRGRWPVEPFAVRLAENAYELEEGGGEGLSVDARVLLFVETNRGASKSAVRAGVQGRAATIDAAIARLLSRGAIRNSGSSDRMVLFPNTGDQGEVPLAA